MTTENELILFVKAPLPGKVKTRLVPPLSFLQAAGLYKDWTLETYQTATQLLPVVRVAIAYEADPQIPTPVWLSPANSNVPDFSQESGDLGKTLAHAFSLDIGRSAKRVVIIGTDSPGLPLSYLRQAFQDLEDHDLVLGPAYDGGYYLVGLKDRLYRKLFEGIDWSTSRVLSKTLRRAKALKLAACLIPRYFDIDTGQDLKRFLNKETILR